MKLPTPVVPGVRPVRPVVSAGAMYALHAVMAKNALWTGVARAIESTGPLYRAFTAVEHLVKGRLFGCRMCGQCALPVTAYACPMTCPKQLRNGPCGGVSAAGMCEVFPDQGCVWNIAYDRAAGAGRVADLRRIQFPVDQRESGRSSWINYWQGRDEALWTDAPA